MSTIEYDVELDVSGSEAFIQGFVVYPTNNERGRVYLTFRDNGQAVSRLVPDGWTASTVDYVVQSVDSWGRYWHNAMKHWDVADPAENGSTFVKRGVLVVTNTNAAAAAALTVTADTPEVEVTDEMVDAFYAAVGEFADIDEDDVREGIAAVLALLPSAVADDFDVDAEDSDPDLVDGGDEETDTDTDVEVLDGGGVFDTQVSLILYVKNPEDVSELSEAMHDVKDFFLENAGDKLQAVSLTSFINFGGGSE